MTLMGHRSSLALPLQLNACPPTLYVCAGYEGKSENNSAPPLTPIRHRSDTDLTQAQKQESAVEEEVPMKRLHSLNTSQTTLQHSTTNWDALDDMEWTLKAMQFTAHPSLTTLGLINIERAAEL